MDNPKGAMITSKGLLLATNCMYSMGYHISDQDRILSFLPFAHIMEQILFSLCLVSRVFEKMYKTIMDNINKKSPLITRLFNMALNVKIK